MDDALFDTVEKIEIIKPTLNECEIERNCIDITDKNGAVIKKKYDYSHVNFSIVGKLRNGKDFKIELENIEKCKFITYE